MKTPILIVGAGPAGCAASYELSNHKIPHLMLDKAIFPRDKICGDGLSPRVFFVLRKVYPELISKMAAHPNLFRVMETGMGVAPNGIVADLPLINPFNDGLAPAFSAKRQDFDNFLVENLDTQFAELWQNTIVKTVIRKDKGFIVSVLSNCT